MDAESGVATENESGIIERMTLVDDLGPSSDKEKENVEDGGDSLQVNNVLEDLSRAESLNSGVAEDEVSSTAASKNHSSNLAKKKSGAERGDCSTSGKMSKNEVDRKGLMSFLRNQKAGLSQSLSFPVRGTPTSGPRKSTGEKQMKLDTKQAQMNIMETASVVSNGSLTSTLRSNHSNKKGESSVEANARRGLSTRRTSLAFIPSIRQSVPRKSRSSSGNFNVSSSEAIQAWDQSQKPSRRGLPIKDDEDAHSTTSNTTRRSSSTGFASRLNERAEKRKEFFSKLEEKIHAKELEKSNLQAQSKESQEAEIKKLRKSLTFKATPMPSFYHEPAPPKIELKKMPTTRPKSPKLGRHKPPSAVVDNSPKVDGSYGSSYSSLDTNKLNGGSQPSIPGDSKKSIQRSLLKIPSQKSSATKPEGKPLSTKSNITNPENNSANDCTVESQNKSGEDSFPEIEAKSEIVLTQDAVEGNKTILNFSDPVNTLNEVSVIVKVIG